MGLFASKSSKPQDDIISSVNFVDKLKKRVIHVLLLNLKIFILQILSPQPLKRLKKIKCHGVTKRFANIDNKN